MRIANVFVGTQFSPSIHKQLSPQILYSKLFIVMGIPWIFECGHYFAHGDHAVAECLSTTEFVLRCKQTTKTNTKTQTNVHKFTQIDKNINISPTATVRLLSAFHTLILYTYYYLLLLII